MFRNSEFHYVSPIHEANVVDTSVEMVASAVRDASFEIDHCAVTDTRTAMAYPTAVYSRGHDIYSFHLFRLVSST